MSDEGRGKRDEDEGQETREELAVLTSGDRCIMIATISYVCDT